MDISSDNSSAADEGRGFQFPGTFELSAMGAADKDLETVLPTLLLDAGIEVLHETVNWKLSSTGRYVSVRIAFRADTREDYDRAHQALRDHPEVKWTL
jgi:putative lipoic acid-binding regulatory protein